MVIVLGDGDVVLSSDVLVLIGFVSCRCWLLLFS